MIYVFLVDTSVSMNVPLSGRLTALEVAKAGIDQFFKWELRKTEYERRNNKYMLVTTPSRPPASRSAHVVAHVVAYVVAPARRSPRPPRLHVQTLLTTDHQTLLAHARSLQALDLSNVGTVFAALFEYLSLVRCARTRADAPAIGRFMGGHESTLIFWFMDASAPACSVVPGTDADDVSVTQTVNIPGLRMPGSEVYRQPFRWEQRLYTIGLMPDHMPVHPQLEWLSLNLGGQFWRIGSMRSMQWCMESCMGATSTVRPGVLPTHAVSHIEGVRVRVHIDPDETGAPQATDELLLYASATSSRTFPIPEAYWPERYLTNTADAAASGGGGGSGSGGVFRLDETAQRDAYPTLTLFRREQYYPLFEGFPVDRVGMLPNAVSAELAKLPAGVCWPVYVQGSSFKPGYGEPFGFLKQGSTNGSVYLYILPYKFPTLFKLLTAVVGPKAPIRLPDKWTQSFLAYVASLPCYYVQPLRNALAAMKLGHLWPTDAVRGIDGPAGVPVYKTLARITEYGERVARMASVELDKFVATVQAHQAAAAAKKPAGGPSGAPSGGPSGSGTSGGGTLAALVGDNVFKMSVDSMADVVAAARRLVTTTGSAALPPATAALPDDSHAPGTAPRRLTARRLSQSDLGKPPTPSPPAWPRVGISCWRTLLLTPTLIAWTYGRTDSCIRCR
ncbi:hypothetical protein BC831DRAFT_83538 [Entophlyctis helioformis]|nr:hypothetical protein BC831DRAFT_83538 [Entophlyctis helioformis]